MNTPNPQNPYESLLKEALTIIECSDYAGSSLQKTIEWNKSVEKFKKDYYEIIENKPPKVV